MELTTGYIEDLFQSIKDMGIDYTIVSESKRSMVSGTLTDYMKISIDKDSSDKLIKITNIETMILYKEVINNLEHIIETLEIDGFKYDFFYSGLSLHIFLPKENESLKYINKFKR